MATSWTYVYTAGQRFAKVWRGSQRVGSPMLEVGGGDLTNASEPLVQIAVHEAVQSGVSNGTITMTAS